MTFRFPDSLAVLDFPDWPGLEVTVRLSPIPLQTYMDLHARMMAVFDNTKVSDRMEAWRKLAVEWAPLALVSWNLDAKVSDIAGQPWEFLSALLMGWSQGVAQVPLPLLPRSSGGTTSTREASPPNSSARRRSRGSSTDTPATP